MLRYYYIFLNDSYSVNPILLLVDGFNTGIIHFPQVFHKIVRTIFVPFIDFVLNICFKTLQLSMFNRL